MLSFKVLSFSALVAIAQAHNGVTAVFGNEGSPQGVGFKIDLENIARNCTTINPCQQDAVIIRDAEIEQGITGVCGRNEIDGPIDREQGLEDAIAANAVPEVSPGSELIMTFHQVNADGAGPLACDLMENGDVISADLTVKNNIPGANGFSQEKFKDFNVTVVMPQNLNCQSASTGDLCTVRCRNNAQAGPFGGCVAVRQADAAGAGNGNNANNNNRGGNRNNNANANGNQRNNKQQKRDILRALRASN